MPRAGGIAAAMNGPASDNADRTVTIIGGGLAGLAAAARLAEQGVAVELFEARGRLGGRATSFRDPDTGELVDHCQHVSMGCCTNLADFCRRTGLDSSFRRERTLHVIAPDGAQHDLAASRWLPPPLHFVGPLGRLRFLTAEERRGIVRAMRVLVGRGYDAQPEETMAQWLARHGQSAAAIEGFWTVVLTSALGDTLERLSVAPARTVFREGFLTNRRAYELLVPEQPLDDVYGARLVDWLRKRGVVLHTSTAVRRITGNAERVSSIELGDGSLHPVRHVISAVPWRRVGSLFDPGALRDALAWLSGIERIEGSPITAVHLWFDRPVTPLAHAILVGRLGQWLFRRGVPDAGSTHYYQVVISGSHALAGSKREQIVERIVAELAECFPAARSAALIRSRVVTEPNAVFSLAPGVEQLRPPQQTAVPNLAVAGDWTRTGWPATMESAVRSGYLSAEAALKQMGVAARLLVDDLPESQAVRLLFGRR